MNVHHIVSRPIEKDAGRNHRIAIVDEDLLGMGQGCADLTILFATIV
ncbi:MAG: hypothetical protein JW394_0767 [Nitrospira sp.]|nr:hypothetical protein [Nitrospira sp.]